MINYRSTFKPVVFRISIVVILRRLHSATVKRQQLENSAFGTNIAFQLNSSSPGVITHVKFCIIKQSSSAAYRTKIYGQFHLSAKWLRRNGLMVKESPGEYTLSGKSRMIMCFFNSNFCEPRCNLFCENPNYSHSNILQHLTVI